MDDSGGVSLCELRAAAVLLIKHGSLSGVRRIRLLLRGGIMVRVLIM